MRGLGRITDSSSSPKVLRPEHMAMLENMRNSVIGFKSKLVLLEGSENCSPLHSFSVE